MLWAYLLALAVTVVLETAVALLLGGSARRRLLADAPWINAFTHPLAFLLLDQANVPLLAIEAGAVAVEALAYRQVTGLEAAHAVAIALVANGLTALVGLLAWPPMG